jgi:hypothetical protein
MTQAQQRQMTTAPPSQPTSDRSTPSSTGLRLWQVNLLRVGYFVMGAGLAVYKWPLLVDHGPWGLAEGTVQCMLVAMSVLALLGLRYPTRMLPILLFEVAWKLTWLGVMALPLWSDGTLVGAAREQTVTVLWVAIIIAVIPWGHVVRQYGSAPGEAWLRRGR